MVCFYRAQYVGPFKALYTLLPGKPVHSDTHSTSLESILAMQQLRMKTIHSQVIIYKAEGTEVSWIERKCPNFKTVAKGGFEPGGDIALNPSLRKSKRE